jgi:hypothetical protein
VFLWKQGFYHSDSRPRDDVVASQPEARTFSAFPCGFAPTGEFVLRQLLNHDGMNKLSELSVSVSFTLRVTCLDPFPYMLPNVFIQSIGHVSHVLRLA